MQNVVQGAIRHPVGDDDGVGGRRRLTCAQHGEDIWVREDPEMGVGGGGGKEKRKKKKKKKKNPTVF